MVNPPASRMPILGAAQPLREPGFTRWSLEASDVSQLIEAMLRGATFTVDKKDPTKVVAIIPEDENQAVLNEKGRKLVLSVLSSLSHKGISLSNFSGVVIAKRVMNLHEKMSDKLLYYWDEVGVKSPEDIPEITYIIMTNVEAAMRRALGGSTWLGIQKSHSVIETRRDEGKGGGIFKVLGGGET